MDNATKDRIRELKRLMDSGSRVSGGDVTALYNGVFSRRLAPTNCSTCVKRRITALWQRLQREEKDNGKDESDSGVTVGTEQG